MSDDHLTLVSENRLRELLRIEQKFLIAQATLNSLASINELAHNTLTKIKELK